MKAVDKCPHYVGVAIFGGNFVLNKVCRGLQCPLFGVERCLFPGGSKCISSVIKSIGGK